MEGGCSLPDLVMDGCSVSEGEDGLTGYWEVQCAHQGVRERCDEVTGGKRGGLTERTEPNDVLSDAQGGFTNTYSTQDHIFTLYACVRNVCYTMVNLMLPM